MEIIETLNFHTTTAQVLFDLFCEDKNIDRVGIHVSYNLTCIEGVKAKGLYNIASGLITLDAAKGCTWATACHELAHHYQEYIYDAKSHHDSTFTASKKVVTRWFAKHGYLVRIS